MLAGLARVLARVGLPGATSTGPEPEHRSGSAHDIAHSTANGSTSWSPEGVSLGRWSASADGLFVVTTCLP